MMSPGFQILVVSQFFWPGFNAGGPVRSLTALVRRLGDRYRFGVMTGDRDLGVAQPYPEVVTEAWTPFESAQVMYLAPSPRRIIAFRRVVQVERPGVLYLNSMFSTWLSVPALAMRRFGSFAGLPTVLAPRGELSEGALRIKARKKAVFLRLSKVLQLHRGLIWHACSELEADDFRRAGVPTEAIRVAENLSALQINEVESRPAKQEGALHVAVVGRVSPKKNVHLALRALAGLRGRVVCSVIGPVEDVVYAEQCRRAEKELPSNISVEWVGGLPHDLVRARLERCDVMLSPTAGENFGQVFIESFAAGVPVIVSDRTPWRGLAPRGVGADLPLDRPALFEAELRRFEEMGEFEHLRMRRACREFAREHLSDEAPLHRHAEMFAEALAMNPARGARQ